MGVGGATGSMARYAISVFAGKYLTSAFPWGTFAVNVVGGFLIGIFFGLASRGNSWFETTGLLLLGTGFCGGFTTFSTFALENVSLLQKGEFTTITAYGLLSIVAGLALCRLGIWLTA